MARIDLKEVTMKIQDGTTPTPLEIELKLGDGNFTFTETIEREYFTEKGVLDTVRNGNETPMEITADGTWEYYGSVALSTVPTIIDALKRTGEASAWVSTAADPCEPYAVDIVLENVPVCPGGAPANSNETLTFPDFRVDTITADAQAATFQFTGRCNAVEPLSVRS